MKIMYSVKGRLADESIRQCTHIGAASSSTGLGGGGEARPMIGKARCTVSVGENHSISYYDATSDSTARFEATCRDPNHKDAAGRYTCRLTRHITEESLQNASSRPLGLLMAWLLIHHLFPNKQKHTDKVIIKALLYEERLEGREQLRLLPNGPYMLSLERNRLPSEPSEEPMASP